MRESKDTFENEGLLKVELRQRIRSKLNIFKPGNAYTRPAELYMIDIDRIRRESNSGYFNIKFRQHWFIKIFDCNSIHHHVNFLKNTIHEKIKVFFGSSRNIIINLIPLRK